MNAAIAAAVFQPRSLPIMKTFAMHGNEERDRDHRDDELGGVESAPRDMSKSRVAPKSRRRKPMRNAAEASAGRPRTPVTIGLPPR